MQQKKRKYVRYIFRVFAILWMALIFSMSARDADLSTEDSNTVGYYIARMTVSGFDEMTATEQQVYIDALDHGIRKSAHMTEYAILAILICFSFEAPGILKPWLCTVLYAMSDECHQLFVPGRSGQFTDVCIDGAGAFLGLVLILIIQYLCRAWRYKKSENVD